MSIGKSLAKRIANYDADDSIGSGFRKRRITPLLEMIQETYEQQGFVNIVDIGGRENYWNIVSKSILDKCNVSITIVNLFEAALPEDNGPFKFVFADACDLSMFPDNSFHIAHSNSVVEHVGDWERMVLFARELSRVSEQYFVQTPNYWFPVEPHCMMPLFHWFPKPMRVWLVSRFQLGHWRKASSIGEAVKIVDSARLLNRKMFQELFKDAHVATERLFGMPKSFIAVRRRKGASIN